MGVPRAPYMAKTDKERLATGFWNCRESNQAADCNRVCDADKDKLQNAYKEAHKLVDNALKSLNSLSKRRTDFIADDVC